MNGMMAIALGCALLTAGAVPFAAVSATYKWIDERGVVNYGNAPPAAGRDVRRLDENASRVSTIEAVPRAQRDREEAFLLRARIARLEAELEEQRRLRAVAPLPAPVHELYPAYPPVVAGYFPFFRTPHFRPRAGWVHRPVHLAPRGGVTIRIGRHR
jgi:hypothetical protein